MWGHPPRYDHNVCVHEPTSNCDFNFWCYMSLKCIKDWHPLSLYSTPPTTNPSTQLLCWHLKTNTLCSCSSGTFLWFRITCGETCYHLLITECNSYTGDFFLHCPITCGRKATIFSFNSAGNLWHSEVLLWRHNPFPCDICTHHSHWSWNDATFCSVTRQVPMLHILLSHK